MKRITFLLLISLSFPLYATSPEYYRTSDPDKFAAYQQRLKDRKEEAQRIRLTRNYPSYDRPHLTHNYPKYERIILSPSHSYLIPYCSPSRRSIYADEQQHAGRMSQLLYDQISTQSRISNQE